MSHPFFFFLKVALAAVKFPRLAPVLLLAAAFLFPVAPLAAQETMGNYFVRQSEIGEQTIVQRLAWPVDENVSRYEVVVESGGPDAFAEIHRESTEGGFIDISLGPGKYRYQVLVYNLLNQFEYATNWASFNIILALQPEIVSHTPDIMYIYEDYGAELRITITGRDLVEDAEVLVLPLESPENPATRPLVVKNYIPSGETALLVLERADLLPGVYRILVRNPGGLEATSGPVYVDTFLPASIEISAAYAPLVPLYGYLFDILDGFAPVGMELKAAYVFFKRPWGFLGIETNFHFTYLSASNNTADASAFIIGAEAGLLYRKLSPVDRLVFNARLRGGISAAPFYLVFDYESYKSDPITSWVPQAVLGVSLEWRFTDRFYAELGVDYTHLFSHDLVQPGFLRPFLGAGWKFFVPGKLL
jgi:hypothetical protein